ncbi:MAG: hypothetical protein ACI85F_001144 [Bacteroidia bacterium]
MSKDKSLPHFLGIGAPKCGTTSLHDILIDHPQIYLPADKELHYFDNPSHYEKGNDWYSKQFDECDNTLVKGEITPAYMSYPESAERIHRCLGPDVKLIMMFREPVERAFSEYQHNYRRGLVNEPTFDLAVERELNDVQTKGFDKRVFSFIERGKYADQVERLLKYFPKENMLFIRFREDFIADKEKCISDVLSFIGVDPAELQINKKSNAAFNPKSRFVTKLVEKDNTLRLMARKLVASPMVRKKLRSIVNSINTKEGGQTPKLSLTQRIEFQERFYSGERERLEQHIGKPLPSWDLSLKG